MFSSTINLVCLPEIKFQQTVVLGKPKGLSRGVDNTITDHDDYYLRYYDNLEECSHASLKCIINDAVLRHNGAKL